MAVRCQSKNITWNRSMACRDTIGLLSLRVYERECSLWACSRWLKFSPVLEWTEIESEEEAQIWQTHLHLYKLVRPFLDDFFLRTFLPNTFFLMTLLYEFMIIIQWPSIKWLQTLLRTRKVVPLICIQCILWQHYVPSCWSFQLCVQ